MSFIQKFPLATFSFLGISCVLTEFKHVIIDFSSGKAAFCAKCNLFAGPQQVYLDTCRFEENIAWQFTENAVIDTFEFSLFKENGQMYVNFSASLSQLDPFLG